MVAHGDYYDVFAGWNEGENFAHQKDREELKGQSSEC